MNYGCSNIDGAVLICVLSRVVFVSTSIIIIHNSPIILVPGAQILGDFIVLSVPRPHGALLNRRDAVLIGRDLGHVVTELICGAVEYITLLETAAGVVAVVQGVGG